jgi:hypothetical protein
MVHMPPLRDPSADMTGAIDLIVAENLKIGEKLRERRAIMRRHPARACFANELIVRTKELGHQSRPDLH